MKRSRPWLALGWLLFLAYPVAGFFTQARSPGEWTLFWGALLAFVALYAAYQFRTGADTRWALTGYFGALLTFAALFGVVGTYALGLLVYGAYMVGYQRRRSWALGLTGAYVLLTCGLAWLLAPDWTGQSWSWAVPLGAALNGVFLFFSALLSHQGWRADTARAAFVRAQAEKEKLAADAERERIARDLHDLLGHTLSVIVLKSELAGKLATKNPERAAEEIRDVERISREALTEVRAAVRGYRGSGFASELARAKVALDTAGIRLTVTDTLPSLPEHLESTLAMVLREGVTNVVRHSGAKELRLTLRRERGGLLLVLHDDGRGSNAPEGTGLGSMRERLRAMGGHLELSGDGGMRVAAWVPGDAEGGAQRAEGVAHV